MLIKINNIIDTAFNIFNHQYAIESNRFSVSFRFLVSITSHSFMSSLFASPHIHIPAYPPTQLLFSESCPCNQSLLSLVVICPSLSIIHTSRWLSSICIISKTTRSASLVCSKIFFLCNPFHSPLYKPVLCRPANCCPFFKRNGCRNAPQKSCVGQPANRTLLVAWPTPKTSSLPAAPCSSPSARFARHTILIPTLGLGITGWVLVLRMVFLNHFSPYRFGVTHYGHVHQFLHNPYFSELVWVAGLVLTSAQVIICSPVSSAGFYGPDCR